MALKPKMANSVKVDDHGYALATLTDITFLDSDESEYEREQFLFDFLAEGTKKPINLKLWTGTIINAERYENGKNKDYSKLTRLCLQLGLINEPDLKQAYRDGKDIDLDLDSLKGLKVRFKLLKQAKTRNLSQIDLNTLEPIKEPVKETK
ncbi:hypothetical protein [Gloeothece verrucosa]|uniref:Uncharacterized protein n=1 Tax=Gloeothece verrucosa (strain PCC 7822) TaxID=497965 RepID=E0UP05_GLOV7|nr:hypothetical protein [Gloeothece verrucosa]ADN18685.1 hypothetical protein Cyan7822_6203 [Gloeothece verrucosa PCC 7822]